MSLLRYLPPSSADFIDHRERLRASLPGGAMVVIHSNDQMPTNADGLMPFKQNSNFYYLSGIDQQESILIIFPAAQDPAHRELLFLKTTTPALAIWDGEKLTPELAYEHSGIQDVQPLESFERLFSQLVSQATYLYLETNEHYRADVVVQSRNDRFIATCQQSYPLHQYRRLAPLMAQLRSTKSPAEVQQIQRACQITSRGFTHALKHITPGRKEYEIEAIYSQVFLSSGSRGFAYAPIIATGSNACILHYITNASTCQAEDMLLMDVGAEYGNYYADMTRSVPVSGRFSPRQRAIYESVLSALRYAKSLLRPGVLIKEYQQEVEIFVEDQLCQLGLLTRQQIQRQDPKQPARKAYFMHGVSHHLGLDVHDVPLMYEPLSAGAVLSVEPGIYVREEGIGIRLENDVLITETGTEDLMADIPIEVDEIEEQMNTSASSPVLR